MELRPEVVTAAVPRRADEGRFHAVWRRENPTTKGQPFTFVAGEGQGHLVGCLLQAQGMVSGETPFFEGDDETTLDGETTIRGTGSEDFFNGGWYDVPDRWEKTLSFPLSGCLDYQKPLGRSGGYRLMLGDAYAFRQSIRQTIEHAPTGNDLETDYVGVTYLYLATSAGSFADGLPPVADRRVVDPTRIVFKPAWAVPIRAFTFRNATLTKIDEDVDGQTHQFPADAGGSQRLVWHAVHRCSSAICRPPASTVSRSRPSRAPHRASGPAVPQRMAVAPPVDLYAEQRAHERARADWVRSTLVEGPNTLMLKLVGKHDKSTGYGLDLATIQYERID